LISADRLFGLLEREFDRTDIESSVAKALKSKSPDLSAHQIMIDLATTPAGLVRLVTTNFDRLFNDCDGKLNSWQPPNLPSLTHPKKLNGIVYLHGRVSTDYSCAEEDGFILSSSEFGRAYLAEAWATEFFKEILSKYSVVFVGYGADDPPVHYLLEALSNGGENLQRIYAFQSGSHEEARARWQHKGVEAIAYNSADNHKDLWNSLECWATRAKDIEQWYQSIMELAARGPSELSAFERGLVAHVISSTEGAKLFSQAENPPSAEWLLVFDKHCRYESPSRFGRMIDSGKVVDLFERYGIDFDTVPERTASEDYYAKREQPLDAWNAFDLTHVDRAERLDSQFASLNGSYSENPPELCSRLRHIGSWIAKVAADPITLLWVHRQGNLHPNVITQLKSNLDNQKYSEFPEVAKAWRYLFEANLDKVETHDFSWYVLQSRVAKEKWTWGVVRCYLDCLRPRLVIDSNYGFAPILNETNPLDIKSIIRPMIYYPNPDVDIEVPEVWLPHIIEGLRQHLHTAIQLESDVGTHSISDCSSLTPDIDDADEYVENDSVSILLLRIARNFELLVESNISAAIKEFETWRSYDSKYFILLLVWASRNSKVASFQTVENIFVKKLDSELFWSTNLEHDSLLTLQARWACMSEVGRLKIEKKIVKGPSKRDEEDEGVFQNRRALWIINRLYFLRDYGCRLQIDLDVIVEELKTLVPRLNLKDINAEDNTEGGFVRVEKSYSALEYLPVDEVLKVAGNMRGKTEHFLIQAEPFEGYAAAFPQKAFSSLNSVAQKGEYPDWAWKVFLRSEKRENDELLLMKLIAESLCEHPDSAFNLLIVDVTSWLNRVSKPLLISFSQLYYKLFDKLLDVTERSPDLFSSNISYKKEQVDWVLDTINSPISPLLQSLFNDPRLEENKQEIPIDWLSKVTRALQLDGNLSKYSLVIFNHNLAWFYLRDVKWTRKHLLSLRNKECLNVRQAFWSGFFWGAKTPSPSLYREIRESMLIYAQGIEFSNKGHSKILAKIILSGWDSIDETTNEPYISNSQFRQFLVKCDDAYRAHVLWQVRNVSTKQSENGNWKDQIKKLLVEVWPKQISVKSPLTTTRLCELVFSSKSIFEQVGVFVLPHLVKLTSRSVSSPIIRFENYDVVKSNPELVLAIVFKILPDDARAWPYKIEDVFTCIEEADSELKYDERMIEIKRKWNSR
jgi:hypothetical protein